MFAEDFWEAHRMSAEPAIPPREFAQRVLQGFEDADLATSAEIEMAGGPSTTTMTKYRKIAAGELDMPKEPRGDTYKAIDTAAKWEPGSARALWRKGAEPTPLLPGTTSKYSARIRRILAQGNVDQEVREELERLANELDESAS